MFLPISYAELLEQGIDVPDFVVVSGDAYVDHPSFGHALIGRLLQHLGFSVAVLAQPISDKDYLKLPPPRIAYMVTSGVVDSMVNNYTASKQKRKGDDYSEGGEGGKRPDRALTVYCKTLKRLFPEVPVVVGGLEASLRRFAHYDYHADTVMQSVLVDTNADLLIYGMGEQPLIDLARLLNRGIPITALKDVRGTAFFASELPKKCESYTEIASFERVKSNKKQYLQAFLASGSASGGLYQRQADGFVVVNPPQLPLSTQDMDMVYSLPYARKPHPVYKRGVPAIEEVEFSITAHRGCFGGCAFCAITYHQGKAIVKRSVNSIVEEATLLTQSPSFKGYIHDVGGPTANFHNPSCEAGCNGNCIGKSVCKNLQVDHSEYLEVLRRVRGLHGVKKVFIRSGIRFDYLMLDKNSEFFEELVAHHVSGQLKVAPEHVSDRVLSAMNKPSHSAYKAFAKRFAKITAQLGKEQYLVPYFICGHPACTLEDAVKLYEYLESINYMPLQVQDFYPTPSTLATTMYYTEMDANGKPIFVAKSNEDKQLQRALLQYRLPKNRELVVKALEKVGRNDLKGRFLLKYVNKGFKTKKR